MVRRRISVEFYTSVIRNLGSSRLEIQPITKKEMESDIASLRSKDNRRRDYYEGDSRPRGRSRSRTRSLLPMLHVVMLS